MCVDLEGIANILSAAQDCVIILNIQEKGVRRTYIVMRNNGEKKAIMAFTSFNTSFKSCVAVKDVTDKVFCKVNQDSLSCT